MRLDSGFEELKTFLKKPLSLDGREAVLYAAVFFVSVLFGVVAGNIVFSEPLDSQGHMELFNITVSDDSSVETVEFRNHSFNLMYESSERAGMYLDFDGDGSFDLELRDLVRDGETHRKSLVHEFSGKAYELSFSYRDNKTARGKGFLRLDRIASTG